MYSYPVAVFPFSLCLLFKTPGNPVGNPNWEPQHSDFTRPAQSRPPRFICTMRLIDPVSFRGRYAKEKNVRAVFQSDQDVCGNSFRLYHDVCNTITCYISDLHPPLWLTYISIYHYKIDLFKWSLNQDWLFHNHHYWYKWSPLLIQVIITINLINHYYWLPIEFIFELWATHSKILETP